MAHLLFLSVHLYKSPCVPEILETLKDLTPTAKINGVFFHQVNGENGFRRETKQKIEKRDENKWRSGYQKKEEGEIKKRRRTRGADSGDQKDHRRGKGNGR